MLDSHTYDYVSTASHGAVQLWDSRDNPAVNSYMPIPLKKVYYVNFKNSVTLCVADADNPESEAITI